MKIFKFCTVEVSSRLAPLAIAVAAAFATQPVFAVPDHQLVFTENSSSSLSVTFDGSTTGISVFNQNADDWFVLFPPTLIFAGSLDWIEPAENSSNSFFGGSGQAFVYSDNVIFPGAQPDGFTYVNAGTDTSDGVPIDVTFHDLGDTVPDTGTTCSLLGLSLMGLAFLRRKLC